MMSAEYGERNHANARIQRNPNESQPVLGNRMARWPLPIRAMVAYPISVAVVAILAMCCGIYGLAHIQKSYMAAAIVTPPAELDRLNLQSSLSGVSGISGLAGLAGGGAQSPSQTRYETFVTLLTSRRVAQALIDKHDILRRLFPQRWDPQRKQWKRPAGVLADLRSRFTIALGYPGWSAPDATTLAKYMSSHLNVSQSLKTSQRSFTFSSRDPILSRDILEWAMEESDASVRTDAIARAKAQLDYVQTALAKSITNSEDRAVLTEILMGTERSVILASTGSTFSCQIIQNAEASATPSSPALLPSLIAIVFVSFGVGLLVAIFRLRYRDGHDG